MAPSDGTLAPRGLRPPPDGALDRAWRRQRWRLQLAHDDWGLHADRSDPRDRIRHAAGLMRLHRQATRDLISAYRRLRAGGGVRPLARRNRLKDLKLAIADEYALYRAWVAETADAIAAFAARDATLADRAGPPSAR
ncbi:MAG: hypothetical protein V3R98_00190 [Alphaproteobacteria bacterium]